MALPAYQEPTEEESSETPSLELQEGGGATSADQRPPLLMVDGGFSDGTPDSVNLQPEQPATSEQQAIFGGGVGNTVGSREQAGYTTGGRSVVPGQTPILDPIGAHQVSEKKSAKEGRIKKLREDYTKTRQAVSEKQAQLKSAISGEIKKKIKAEIRKVIIEFAAEALAPIILPVLAVLAIIIIFVIAIAVAIANLQHGNTPPGSYPIGYSTTVKTAANPEGIYLSMISPTYTVKDKKGNSQLLAVESTAGGFVGENPATATGKTASGYKWYAQNQYLSPVSDGHYDPATGSYNNLTETDIKYYLDMRWPYVQDVHWPLGSGKHAPPITGYASAHYYGGMHVGVAKLNKDNTVTKLVVGSIAEWGPEPAAGICDGAGQQSTTKTTNPRNSANACADQKALWEVPSRMGPSGDFHPPAEYTGEILGATPALAKLIGVENDDIVLAGFMNDQTIPPGTVISVNQSDIVTPGGGSTNNTGTLSVPGVEEGTGGKCGVASINMVGLYYLSSKGSVHLTYDQLPSSMKGWISSNKPNNPAAWFTTVGTEGHGCVTESYLNNMLPKSSGGWSRVAIGAGDKDKMINGIMASIQANDPVVVYTHDVIYSGPHIFVIVGYNAATKEFIVNNPKPGGVDIGVKGAQIGGNALKKPITADLLFSNRGNTYKDYSFSLIIRDTYIK
jgi:hypothetical protein